MTENVKTVDVAVPDAEAEGVAANGADVADVVIIGAGPVGMALAMALAGGPYSVLLIDARRRDAWQADPRALALSHGSRQLLERLGAWNAAVATPIHSIHISQRAGFGRTLIDAGDYGLSALGYVLRYRELAATLAARLDHSLVHYDCATSEIATDHDVARITVKSAGTKRCLAAQLVVHAEGTPGSASDADEVRVYDYRQHAVVAEVCPVESHAQRAWERFTADGPLALLPLGRDYSLVFTVPPERAAQLLNLEEAPFLAALREQFGCRLDFVALRPARQLLAGTACPPTRLRATSGVDRQRRAKPAPCLRPGFQPWPARCLGTG